MAVIVTPTPMKLAAALWTNDLTKVFVSNFGNQSIALSQVSD
jgi:hypothetical protein